MTSDEITNTALLNWLKATADDAMGMEPGDRAMANEARKLIESLLAERESAQQKSDELFDAVHTENLHLKSQVKAMREVVEAARALAERDRYDLAGWATVWDDLDVALDKLNKTKPPQ